MLPVPAAASPSEDPDRFLPGTVFSDRYRIIGLIGRGGMGEVYRADDQKLGRQVALKLLPEDVERDPARLERFLNEVRLALQVTHPNVCRVFDIGDFGGRHYLSMEYVDGEDLASLLRRIGRLPEEKAVEIARQLCAGVAAAHGEGILHRDLKPANVMIDGRGRAKIADFGLASAAEVVEGAESAMGTPAYMAPEQLAGKQATRKSDIYSLGLVLYELFTGHRAFAGQTLAELQRSRQQDAPTHPSKLIERITPSIERVILRCLEAEPDLRPASAAVVAEALPGKDPLAAILAEGQTPAPEDVADAPTAGVLRPTVAWALLAVALVGMPIGVFLGAGTKLISRIDLAKKPAVLEDRARRILDTAGYAGDGADSAYGFVADLKMIDWVERLGVASKGGWATVGERRPQMVRFWYRQSPQPLVRWRGGNFGISLADPPSVVPGMIRVMTDPAGRLLDLEVLPPVPGVRARDSGDGTVSWPALFEEAGLDFASFESVEPSRVPRTPADGRLAWSGPDSDNPDERLRVEAASFESLPVAFQVMGPWRSAAARPAAGIENDSLLRRSIYVALMLLVIAGAALLAWRNLRRGRSDTTSALRLAGIFAALQIVIWALRTHHVPDLLAESEMFIKSAGEALFYGAALAIFYVGLEPFVRRRWPQTLVSWTRLLRGRVRDPLVGRHVLLGAVLGVLLLALNGADAWLEPLLGRTSSPGLDGLSGLRGLTWQLAAVLSAPVRAALDTMGGLILFVLFRVVLRGNGLAALAVIVVGAPAFSTSFEWLSLVVVGGIIATWLVAVIRFGYLSGVVAMTVLYLGLTSGSASLGDWHGNGTVLVLLACAGLAVYGFIVALGGRSALPGEALD